jgi:hypothetical protein
MVLGVCLIFFENMIDKIIHITIVKERITNTANLMLAIIFYMSIPFAVFKYKKIVKIISLFIKKYAILIILLFIFNCIVYKLLIFFIKRPRFTNIDATLVPEFLREFLSTNISGVFTVLIYKYRKKVSKIINKKNRDNIGKNNVTTYE